MPNDKEFELDDLESFSFDDLSLDDVPSAAGAASGEDPLGVWVKSAPEDEKSTGDSPPARQDAPPPPASESLSEEDFLSTEELADLDDSFEFVTVSEEPLEGETALDEDMAFLDTPEALQAERTARDAEASPTFNEVSLDDFVSFDDVSPDDSAQPGASAKTRSEPAFEVPLDDEEGFDEEFLDIDIDIEDDINDEELEIIEGGRPRSSETPNAVQRDGLPSQEVDLSEFVDFEEISPAPNNPLAEGEDLPEVKDVPEFKEPFIQEDGSFFEEAVLEEPLPALEEESEVILDADLEPDDQTDMDHILALEEDLTSGIRDSETAARVETPVSSQPDLAAQILGKIEQELSSIKQEISELKKEVNHLRTAPPAPESVAVEAPQPVEAEDPLAEEKAERASHGFFDEEDDETIALTGDELDNILSTAEISEGEEVGLSLDEDLLSLDAEGNLIEPAPGGTEDSSAVHVTDEEFLAGTALDLNEPVPFQEVAAEPVVEADGLEAEEEPVRLGVPDSIELEESLPLDLDEGETEDLLAEESVEEVSEATELPLEEELGLESVDSVPLAPELTDEVPVASEEWDLDSLPPFDSQQEGLNGDAEGWSAPPSETPDKNEPAAPDLPEVPLPPPPTVSAPPDSRAPLPSGLKDELKAVLSYMDKLLASLPDDKIQEFAESEHFEVYKRLFEELGLIE
jgi:hypothetical protein